MKIKKKIDAPHLGRNPGDDRGGVWLKKIEWNEPEICIRQYCAECTIAAASGGSDELPDKNSNLRLSLYPRSPRGRKYGLAQSAVVDWTNNACFCRALSAMYCNGNIVVRSGLARNSYCWKQLAPSKMYRYSLHESIPWCFVWFFKNLTGHPPAKIITITQSYSFVHTIEINNSCKIRVTF